MKLRPYQAEALSRIKSEHATKDSTLLVMATGLGKTIVFCHYANEMIESGRVMVLAHRAELIHQAVKHLRNITGEEPDIEMADYHSRMGAMFGARTVVSTVQTQIAGMNGDGRMTKFDPNDFSLLIVDEAHHSPAQSYLRVLDYYKQNPNLKILGVTATPDRADERALGKVYQSAAWEYGIREGIEDGWLVPINQLSIHVSGLDYSQVRKQAGDLNQKDLCEILEWEENLHRMAAPMIDICGSKKTLVFTVSVKQAERMCEILNRHRSGCAEWVCGTTPTDERRYIFQRYAQMDFQYLVNVGVATEGFDDPGIEIVALGRPTRSRSLYAQMIGRGTRTLPGTIDGLGSPDERKNRIQMSRKPTLDVLDFVGNSGRHRLVSTADILGGDYDKEVVKRAAKNLKKAGAGDVLTELQKAERAIVAEQRREQEQEQRKGILVRAKYSTAKINPFDVLSVYPVREKSWHRDRPPTMKQLNFLAKWGVDTSGLSFTHASQIIGTLLKRKDNKLCTYKQAKVLRKYGYDVTDVTFKQASQLIDQLAKNNWRRK